MEIPNPVNPFILKILIQTLLCKNLGWRQPGLPVIPQGANEVA